MIEIAVQNTLGTETYGLYFESFNFSYIFFILLDLGLSNYASRTVAGDPGSLRRLFPAMLSIKLLLTLVYFVVLLAAAFILRYDAEHIKVVLFIALNHVLMSMLVFLRSNISGLHLFRTDAVLSVADRLVMGLLCAILLWVPFFHDGFNLNWFLATQFTGYVLATLIAFWAVMKQGVGLRVFFNRKEFWGMIKHSYPFAVLFFLMGLYTRIDSVMLGRILDDGNFEVGIYASAFRLLDATIMFAVLLSNLLLPMFARLISKGESVRGLVMESYYILLIPTVLLPLSCFYYADSIYPLLYRENHEYGSAVFGLLFLNFIPMAMGYIFGTLLTAKSELKLLNYISIAGLVVNVVLNALFIPQWQAMGAVAATLITQTLVTISSMYYSIRYFDIQLSDLINKKVLGYCLTMLLVFHGFQMLEWDWVVSISSSLIVGFILLPVFGLFRLKQIKAMLGKE